MKRLIAVLLLSVATLAFAGENSQCDVIEYAEAKDMPKQQLLATICFNTIHYERYMSQRAYAPAQVCYNGMSKARNVLYNFHHYSVDHLNKALLKACTAKPR
jgi:hypothetical protein